MVIIYKIKSYGNNGSELLGYSFRCSFIYDYWCLVVWPIVREKMDGNCWSKSIRSGGQKSAGPLYAVQFVLTLFQVVVLAHLVADTNIAGGLERSLWIWAAFIIPTLAGAVMWTNETAKLKWARFLIQGGYQLVLFTVFGLLLQFWK
jgi:hypothetical protein